MLRRTLVANGTKRHFAATQQTVAIGGKADIGRWRPFCPKADLRPSIFALQTKP